MKQSAHLASSSAVAVVDDFFARLDNNVPTSDSLDVPLLVWLPRNNDLLIAALTASTEDSEWESALPVTNDPAANDALMDGARAWRCRIQRTCCDVWLRRDRADFACLLHDWTNQLGYVSMVVHGRTISDAPIRARRSFR